MSEAPLPTHRTSKSISRTTRVLEKRRPECRLGGSPREGGLRHFDGLPTHRI